MKHHPVRGYSISLSCCFASLLFSISVIAQNVVPNSGFESFTTCPGAISQFDSYVTDWFNPSNGGANGSPDYLNSCAVSTVSVPDNIRGFQYAHGGNAYCGIVIARGNYNQNFREYIEVPFSNTLEADSCYHFEMYFNLANISQFNSDAIQIYFSDTLVTGISNPYPLPFTPQISNTAGNFPDSVNWGVISANYIATGSENYMIIGNFYDSLNSTLVPFNNTGSNVAFVFIDDVTLVKVPCALTTGFVADENNVCPGTCINFTNLSSGATSYIWNFPGASPASSTSVNPVNICYANPGSYDVQLITINGSGSDTLLLANYISVYPSPPPQSITQSGDTLFAILGSDSYQWYFNGSIINGATDYFYVAQASGDFNVVATDGNGCEVEAVVFNVLAGLQSTVDSRQLTIFPNPVENYVRFNIEEVKFETAFSISIYNVLGELATLPISIRMASVDCPLPECSLDVSGLPAGLYYLEITSNNKVFRSKFVKQ